MAENVTQFPFYINFGDVDDYCFWLLEQYGENAECVNLIDERYEQELTNPTKNADDLLLEIRQCLVDNGFAREIEACDKSFSEERKKREKKNPYIPMHKRWELDKQLQGEK